jgi:hypothetical protein
MSHNCLKGTRKDFAEDHMNPEDYLSNIWLWRLISAFQECPYRRTKLSFDREQHTKTLRLYASDKDSGRRQRLWPQVESKK